MAALENSPGDREGPEVAAPWPTSVVRCCQPDLGRGGRTAHPTSTARSRPPDAGWGGRTVLSTGTVGDQAQNGEELEDTTPRPTSGARRPLPGSQIDRETESVLFPYRPRGIRAALRLHFVPLDTVTLRGAAAMTALEDLTSDCKGLEDAVPQPTSVARHCSPDAGRGAHRPPHRHGSIMSTGRWLGGTHRPPHRHGGGPGTGVCAHVLRPRLRWRLATSKGGSGDGGSHGRGLSSARV